MHIKSPFKGAFFLDLCTVMAQNDTANHQNDASVKFSLKAYKRFVDLKRANTLSNPYQSSNQMTYIKLTLAVAFLAILTFILPTACTKGPTTIVTDTVTVIKNDTTIKTLTDTLYATKPDSTVNLTKGLLVYLNFSGNIVDSSGNNNLTTAVGNVLTYDEHGYANSAFGANGGGERVYVSNNGSIQFDTAWALSFGFMVNSTDQQAYISMIDPVTGFAPTFIVGTTYAGIHSIDIGTGDITHGCDSYGTNDSVNITDTSTFVPVLGAWYNAIVIYHKGSLQFYINGSLVSSKTGMGAAANLCPNSELIIGAWWNYQPIGMNGKLDNVRLYNRVLSPHEIVALSANYQVTSNSQRPAVRTAPVHKAF
jgi:hypothetical protein